MSLGGARYCATFAPPYVGADYGTDPLLDPDGYGSSAQTPQDISRRSG